VIHHLVRDSIRFMCGIDSNLFALKKIESLIHAVSSLNWALIGFIRKVSYKH